MANHNLPIAVMELLKKHDMLDEKNFWKHTQSGKWILSHQACEKLAVLEQIAFDLPTMVESDMGKGNVCMVVGGRRGERYEWSTGEASSKNCKNAYPYAMAEKRAKDRVVLKLLGVHADLYSEEEADTFSLADKSNSARRGAMIVGYKDGISNAKGSIYKVVDIIQEAREDGMSEDTVTQLVDFAVSQDYDISELYDALGLEQVSNDNSAHMTPPPV